MLFNEFSHNLLFSLSHTLLVFKFCLLLPLSVFLEFFPIQLAIHSLPLPCSLSFLFMSAFVGQELMAACKTHSFFDFPSFLLASF